MDGIELTEKIMSKYPNVVVIMLTGYDDFEYARRAVKCRVWEYILKPITANEMVRILEEVKRKLDSEGQSRKILANVKSLNNIISLEKEQLLNKLISNKQIEKLDKSLEKLNISLNKEYYTVAIIQPDDREKIIHDLSLDSGEMLSYIMYNISSEIALEFDAQIVFTDYQGKTVIIVEGDSKEIPEQTAIQICNKIRIVIRGVLEFTASVGIGGVHYGLSYISKSYKEAESCLDYHFIHMTDFSMVYSTVTKNLSNGNFKGRYFEEEVQNAVKTHTVELLPNILDELFHKDNFNDIMPREFYFYIKGMAQNLVVMVKELDGGTFIIEQEIGDFEDCDIHLLYSWFYSVCLGAANAIRKNTDKEGLLCARAIAYTDENYADYEISLLSVCKHLNVSISYFSNLFKKKIGLTFIEYLTKIRMEKAKEMLACTNKSISDISEELGYLNTNYFCTVFKKYTSLTPLGYRNKGTDEQGEYKVIKD